MQLVELNILAATAAAILVLFIVGTHALGVTCPEGLVCDCTQEEEHGIDGAKTLEIDCSERNLTQVPDLRSLNGKSVSWIDLSGNNIQYIREDAFMGLTLSPPVYGIWIPRLDIDKNPLYSVSLNAFRGIKTEELLLHIGHSRIKFFPANAFRAIENLTDFFFLYSQVTEIPDNAFLHFKKLRRLDLSGNKLMELNEGIFNGLENRIKSLYLNDMDLQEFPSKALQKLKVLWDLKLDRNSIKSLPDNIFLHFETETDRFIWTMQHNDLTYISPKAFRRTKLRLYETYLNFNNISTVDFLEDPCTLTFKTYGHINLHHNPIDCECPLYSILKAGFYDLHGRCKAPDRFVGVPWISKDYDVMASYDCSNVKVKIWNLPCMTSSKGCRKVWHSGYWWNIMLTIFSFWVFYELAAARI